MRQISHNNDLFRKLKSKVFRKFSKESPVDPKGLTVSYRTDIASVSKFHRNIIEQCFPEDDTGTVAELMADVEAEDCAILLVEEGKNILGGVVVEHYWSTGRKVMLVVWLGVDENHRGRNIGTLLIEEAMSYARVNGASVLLAQVKNPDMSAEVASAYGDPLRRVQFYSRFGCKRMEVPCYIPAFTEDQEPVVGTMLTLFPLSAEQDDATEICLPELAVFVDEYVGQDAGKESRDFVEACKGTVALTSFRTLF